MPALPDGPCPGRPGRPRPRSHRLRPDGVGHGDGHGAHPGNPHPALGAQRRTCAPQAVVAPLRPGAIAAQVRTCPLRSSMPKVLSGLSSASSGLRAQPAPGTRSTTSPPTACGWSPPLPGEGARAAAFAALRTSGARGALDQAFAVALLADRELLARAARALLEANFPATLHNDIAD